MLFRSNDTATTEIYTAIDTLSLHDALPISVSRDDFEAFLRQTAEGIIDVAVREIISEVDRLVFEEEASDVTM